MFNHKIPKLFCCIREISLFAPRQSNLNLRIRKINFQHFKITFSYILTAWQNTSRQAVRPLLYGRGREKIDRAWSFHRQNPYGTDERHNKRQLSRRQAEHPYRVRKGVTGSSFLNSRELNMNIWREEADMFKSRCEMCCLSRELPGYDSARW